jgi:hypothetical protein
LLFPLRPFQVYQRPSRLSQDHLFFHLFQTQVTSFQKAQQLQALTLPVFLSLVAHNHHLYLLFQLRLPCLPCLPCLI